MATPSRWTKWALFSLTVAFLFLWGLSLVVYAFHLSGRWQVRMDNGILLGTCYFGPESLTRDIVFRANVPAPSSRGWPTGWGYQSQFPYRRYTWRNWYPRYSTRPIPNHPGVWSLYVQIPLWIFVMLTGIPAAYLFRRDRNRRLPGHCRGCGYDLFGNTSGKCPECGERLKKPGLQ